jgi:hypothetical protein
MPIAVRRRRASWSVVAEVWTITWQPGIIFGGYLVGCQHIGKYLTLQVRMTYMS